MLDRHMEADDDGKGESKNQDITNHIQKGCRLVEDIDILNAAAQLARLSAPIVGDGVALEDGHQESADPPAEDVDQDSKNGGLEATGGEEADVEGEDGGFDDGHGTGMQDLKGIHDLALRQQIFGQGEAMGRSRGAKVFMLANACDSHPHDVVDRDTEGDDLCGLTCINSGVTSDRLNRTWLTNAHTMR